MIADNTAARVNLDEDRNNASKSDGLSLSPQVIQTLFPVLYFIIYSSNNSTSCFLFVQMFADNTTARVILEEDHQEEVKLK
jgi:hypothetical protein